jgi:hypothetical protein
LELREHTFNYSDTFKFSLARVLLEPPKDIEKIFTEFSSGFFLEDRAAKTTQPLTSDNFQWRDKQKI